jgi:hypothetical protein
MKFYLMRVLEIAPETKTTKMFFGTVMHKAICYLHKDKHIPDLEAIINGCEADTVTGSDGYPPCNIAWKDRDNEINKWMFDARSILERYWADKRNRYTEILLSEAEFTVDIAGFPFTGRIDQLRRNPDGTVILIDFKTGDSRYSDIMMELDFQLSTYDYGVINGKFPDYPDIILPKPDFVGIYHTALHLPYKRKTTVNGVTYQVGDQRPGDILKLTTRTENDFRVMIEDLGRKCRDIMGPTYDGKCLRKGGSFPRSPQNIMGCNTCPVKNECIAMKNKTDHDTDKIQTLVREEDFNG